MSTRIAINGLGRTGRATLRAALRSRLDVEVVAVNDLMPLEQMVRLLAHDSVFGPLPEKVEGGDGLLVVDGRSIAVFGEADPRAVPWSAVEADVVIEATGRFRGRDQAQAHIDAGASRVIISAPGKGVDATFVVGLNEDQFDPRHHWVVSNASCTTNCLAPMIKVLDEAFGVEQGFMSTMHAYTGDQALVDGPHKDPRRARAAAINIIPTSTGAARTTGLVWPSVVDRLDGTALRVPIPDGSVTDLVALLRIPATVGAINDAFQAAAFGDLEGILEYSEDPLVSTDIVGNPASCVFDSLLTMAGGHLVKVFGWYDNEWAYANRLIDLSRILGEARTR